KLMSDEFVYDGSVLSCLEMLSGGITCFNDMYFFPEAVARAALDTGVRAVLSIAVLEFPTPFANTPDEYLRKGLAARDRYRDEPLVRFAMAPHAPYTVSDDTFREIAKLAAELSLPIHVHVHETAQEVRQSLEQHGARPLARLAGLGVVGPDTIAVHAVHLSEHDIDLLREHGASVAHCPHSNLKLASGIAPVARLLAQGINVGIGTDSAASNNRLDLFGEGRTASLLAKGAGGNAATWPAQSMLAAMTINGARALGMDRLIGSLSPGKQADLVAVDLSAPELAPVFDPVSHLVYAAGREHVSDVWVAGRAVVRNRQLAQARAQTLSSEVTARCAVWQNRIRSTVADGS
ncbi:MAG: amidohydrolase family protein, partial [Burkholderiales bacterium]